MLATLRQDVRYGTRVLLKNPTVTFVVALTIALGVGANTTIFSIVNGVLLRPLPFREPSRLVGLRETLPDEGSIPTAYRTFAEWRDRSTVFESIAGMSRWNPNLESGDQPLRVSGMAVSASYFDVMGLRPVVGRTFLPEEDRSGAEKVVVLSNELWRQQFGGDPGIVGRPVKINGKDFKVVGVMPPALSDPEIGWMGIWTQFALDDQKARANPGRYLRINARLKPGVSLEQARAELGRIMSLLRHDFPETHGKEYGVDIRPLSDFVVPERTRSALLILFGVVGCVLLIACVNVANLLLARAVGRAREVSIRAALGATRGRLIRQLLTESLILSMLGAAFGLLLAWGGLRLLLDFNAGAIPRADDVRLDGVVLAFTLAVSVLTGLAFGLAPALVTTRPDLQGMLKEAGRGAGQGLRYHRLRSLLVISEVAAALILLISSGLMVRSYLRLSSVEPGFSLDNVLTAEVNLPATRYDERAQLVGFYRQALERVATQPGVVSAAAAQSLPLRGPIYTDPVFVEGRPVPPTGQEPYIRGNIVTADFFRAMGIEIVEGRSFTEPETWETGDALIVNRSFVRRFFPGEDPLGKRIRLGPDKPWMTVVGVVADTVQSNFEGQTIPEMFYPYTNASEELPVAAMSLVVRTKAEPALVTAGVRDEIRRIDPALPLSNVTTMRALADKALAKPRLNLLLIGIFAAVALVLAAVGIYGVMSYAVTQRTHEIGVRMALGAQGRHVLLLVIGQGMRLMLVGGVVGLLAAFALTRLLESLLYGVSITDPLTFLSAPALLGVVGLLACYFPARRAMSLDPITSLRYE
jgi:predicted permease